VSESYIKGLNGIRALCAMFVLWDHVSQQALCGWKVISLPLPVCCAYVFFAISGFLAGYRIDKIESALSFYKKKVTRLLPLYYSYLVISILVFIVIGQSSQVLGPRLLWYFLMMPQIPFCSHPGILPFVHLWFVGTLVLFYGLCPLFAKIVSQRRIYVAAAIAFIWLFIKLALRAFVGTDSFLYEFVRVTSLDILFAGVWVGLLWKERNPFLVRLENCSAISVIAWLMFLSSGIYGNFIPAPIRPEFMAFLAFLIIITQQTESPFPNLELIFLDWLGKISYEIYVVQFLVIILLSKVYFSLGLEIPDFMIYALSSLMVIGSAWCVNKAIAWAR
jgi:peptidoglycan/LPS O-acetylase OafA/YrhL